MTITYCNFNASGGNEETLQKMYEAFHEEHPNITVEIETIAMDDYFTQMQTRVAGGTAPDCYELNIENFASYANTTAWAMRRPSPGSCSPSLWCAPPSR